MQWRTIRLLIQPHNKDTMLWGSACAPQYAAWKSAGKHPTICVPANAIWKPLWPLAVLPPWKVCIKLIITFGNDVFLTRQVCVGFCLLVSACYIPCSAESSLHTLLAYLTALLSSLISSFEASLQLIENERVHVSLQCLCKAVKETHALSLQDKRQKAPTICKG